jgi:hypothetical protein
MQLGITLPLSPPYADGEDMRIKEALSLGYSSLWLQEWPQGSGLPGQLDHGSGHDPLLHAAYLAQRYRHLGAHIGFAVLRLDYRYPPVAARAVVSAQVFGGQAFHLGMGMKVEDNALEDVKRAASAWSTIRAYLYQPAGADAFVLPPGFTPPRMYLSVRSEALWSGINYSAEGWLTTRYDPREIGPIAHRLRSHAPGLELVLQVFWHIDTRDPYALGRNRCNMVSIGEQRVRQFVRLWREIGVSQVIYYPPVTPDADQLKVLAAAVAEEGR